jgi:glutamate dehydrogenase/leucine dehydrogenase
MEKTTAKSAYINIQNAIARAGIELGFNQATIDTITNPSTIIYESVMVPEIGKNIDMYRVQFNNVLGPYKGGIRFHYDVNLDEIKTLAITMMLKCSLIGIPLGGAKGGATFNPRDYNEKEIQAVARAWARTMVPYIGVDKDIPAPDVNTDEQIMSYILDEYEKVTGRSEPGVITGKPLDLGGSKGRTQATSQGGVYSMLKILEYNPELAGNRKVVIQGFGNVGSNAAILLASEGFSIVGISDSKGAIYSASGLDIVSIESKKSQGKISLHDMFYGDETVQKITNQDLLLCACDILIPAAMENQITIDNASEIKAQMIVELANNPTSSEADIILKERKITVIPDFLANAGGVSVSYFEWVQNRQQYYWSAKEVDDKLYTLIVEATERVYALAQKDTSTLREAGFKIAVERIAKAATLRGHK